MAPTRQAQLQQELTREIRDKAKTAGVFLDTYDPDFILGVIMSWLNENDSALTGKGIRRFRRGG